MDPKQTTRPEKYNGDAHYATALTAALYELLPTKRHDFDTTRMDARNRAQLAQILDQLPSEELSFLTEVARILLVCPEQVQSAISYNGDQAARFRAAMKANGGNARAAYLQTAYAAD